MPNINRELAVPTNRFERALWLDETLPCLLARVPLHAGLAGVAELEASFFPQSLPLDPTCPVCGVETDEGRVDLRDGVYHVRFESCGHELCLSRAELEARMCRPTAKS